MNYVLITFSLAVTRYPIGRILQDEGFVWVHNLRVLVIMAGKEWAEQWVTAVAVTVSGCLLTSFGP